MTTTMEEQIELSGLEITRTSSSSSSSSSLSPIHWNSSNQWSPPLGGARTYQACVVVNVQNGNDSCSYDDDIAVEFIVVLGGRIRPFAEDEIINSVIVWDPSTQQWRSGPSLIDGRAYFAAVVCQDKVYAIGGLNGEDRQVLDTIERIGVSSLLGIEAETTSRSTRQSNNPWTRLPCCLSSPRHGFGAVVIHNRYIVVMGGQSTPVAGSSLASVDILDTAQDNNNGELTTMVAGPSMSSPRCRFAAAVVDNSIFAVGGIVEGRLSISVESLMVQEQHESAISTSSNSNATCTFPTCSSWRVEQHLALSTPFADHDVAKVGSCLIVAGGHKMEVQVLDVGRGIVWNLPNLTIWRPWGCSMVALSDCLVVLGGPDNVESLPLTINRKHKRCNKLITFLIQMEWFSQQR